MTPKAREADLGKQILAARLRRRLSQGAVSRRSGIHPSYLSRIEHGKVRPTLETVRRIADAIGTPLENLLALNPGKEVEGPCPITTAGRCLLDLREAGPHADSDGGTERYSPRRLRILRQLALLLHSGDEETVSAIEVLLDRLVGEAQGEKESG